MKKILTLFLLAVVAVVPFGAYADSAAAKIYVNTKQVQFTESTGIPFESANGRTMVPLRAVMEAFGADVGWDEQTDSATLTKDSTALTVTVNSKTLKLSGGKTIVSDEAPVEINGRMIGVIVPPGRADIEADFVPPGLKAGAAVSAVVFIGVSAYCLIDWQRKKKKA